MRQADRDAGPIVAAVFMTLRVSEVKSDPASAFRSLLKPHDKDGLFGTALHLCVGVLFTALPIAWACFLALT